MHPSRNVCILELEETAPRHRLLTVFSADILQKVQAIQYEMYKQMSDILDNSKMHVIRI